MIAVWIGLATVLAAVVVALRFEVPEMPVTRIVRKDVTAWITSNGQVEPREPHVIAARVDSFVREVHVAPGAMVTAGQSVLTLDATELRAQLARAREEELAAEEQLRIANAGGNAQEQARLESDVRRTDAERLKLVRDRDALQRLVERQAATLEDLAEASIAFERADAERQFLERKRDDLRQRARVDARRASLVAEQSGQTIRLLEDQLRSTAVAAPVAGTVYSVAVKVGQHVRIGDGLAEVADLHQVRVRAFIDEPELGSVGVGQEVLITWDALPGRSWAGRTERVPMAVVPRGGRSVAEVLCAVGNDDVRLLPNINVDVRLRQQSRSHVVAVPRAAVRAAGEERYVFLVRDRRLERRPIAVGIAGTSEYEVLEGLSEGDLVALPGEMALRDGMTVRSVIR
ncbi:MAG TPA: efflux RND transporter periplasmic adaptor subunit [Vicinamibacterales bacterium]|nr:efflux RND transporter periplasmic adaptor subunit [Vicinamibacterales bacterium]